MGSLQDGVTVAQGHRLAHIRKLGQLRNCANRIQEFGLAFSTKVLSSSKEISKWSSIALFPRPVTKTISSMPEATASSTRYWTTGLSTIGSISLGCAFVAGRNRVPNPASGKTALLIALILITPCPVIFLPCPRPIRHRCEGRVPVPEFDFLWLLSKKSGERSRHFSNLINRAKNGSAPCNAEKSVLRIDGYGKEQKTLYSAL